MIAGVVVTAICQVNMVQNRQGNTELATMNVEALARGESDYIICWGEGSIYCPVTNYKVRIAVY